MSPLRVQNPAAYHDRTVQDWHRSMFSSTATAIDVDLLGYCPKCRAPLYLIEATTNPAKSATVVEELARRAGITAMVIRHKDDELVEAIDLTTGVHYFGEDSIRLKVAALRLAHVRVAHPEQRTLMRQSSDDAGVTS